MKRTIRFFGMLSLMAWAVLAQAAMVDRVAAVVNDEVITLSEVYALGGEFIEEQVAGAEGSQAARRELELEVLDSLIQRKLVSAEIEGLQLDVTELELDRTIDDIAGRNGLDRDSLQIEVEKSGLPWSEYKKELRENLRQVKFTQAVIQPRITVDENKLLDAYRRKTSVASRPRIYDLGAIFLSYPEGADEAGTAEVTARVDAALARIRAGETFAAVAAEVDEGPYGAQGGRMGTYRSGELVPELDAVASGLEVGQTSSAIDSARGVFLLHLFGVELEAPVPFEDLREQLLEQVYSEAIEAEMDQWYRQRRRQAAVLIKLESVEAE